MYVHTGEYGSVGKVSIHEYHHIVQQAMLQGVVTSLTPPADTLGNTRFQVKDYGSVGGDWPSHMKGIMDALPAEYAEVPCLPGRRRKTSKRRSRTLRKRSSASGG